MRHFLQDMMDEEEEVMEILRTTVPIIMCDEGLKNLEESNDTCYACKEPFEPEIGDGPVVDHSHVSGKIRGNLHRKCNLQLQT